MAAILATAKAERAVMTAKAGLIAEAIRATRAAKKRACCGTCGSNWALGLFDDGCEECGGGAMTRPCPICGGRCGHEWQRDVHDSQVAGLAYWHGCCSYAVKLFKAQAPQPEDTFLG